MSTTAAQNLRSNRTKIIVLILLLCGFVAGWFVGQVWFRPIEEGGAFQIVQIHGESMLPTYDPGDKVIIKGNSSYDVGDIVVYRAPNDFEPCPECMIIHRIIGQNEDTGEWVIQGDNNPAPDPWELENADLLGKVVVEVF